MRVSWSFRVSPALRPSGWWPRRSSGTSWRAKSEILNLMLELEYSDLHRLWSQPYQPRPTHNRSQPRSGCRQDLAAQRMLDGKVLAEGKQLAGFLGLEGRLAMALGN